MWPADDRRWTSGWRSRLLPVVFLAYLVYVGEAVAQNSPRHAVWGYLALGVFVASYLAILVRSSGPIWVPSEPSWRFWAPYVVLVAAFIAEVPFARAPAFVMCLYITSVGVARLGVRAAPLIAAMAVASLVVPVVIPFWHDSLAKAFDNVAPLAIPVVGIVTYAVVRVHRTNIDLAEARAEVARLAADNERSRIARDLHDLLGHSLTTITLKAGLARRLSDADPKRAGEEIGAVEDLSRQALSEVRSAVSRYRDVTLAAELAQGKELLRASGVTADLPTATDIVDVANQELFGWVVREGITNVARHAHATRCSVRLSASEIEIRDDGMGAQAADGNGIAGLKERVTAAGGTVEAGPLRPHGWRLRVVVDPSFAPP
jgi:two-component system, NarL family, sensor histidine kinase DesK